MVWQIYDVLLCMDQWAVWMGLVYVPVLGGGFMRRKQWTRSRI